MHPVDELEQAEFDYHAGLAAADIAQRGASLVILAPGDCTRYVLAFVKPARMNGEGVMVVEDRPLWMGTSFGELYQVDPHGGYHWGYVAEHWLRDMKSSQEWTARVIARFINALADAMKGDG